MSTVNRVVIGFVCAGMLMPGAAGRTLAQAPATAAAPQAAPAQKPKLYDTTADGFEQIAAATRRATREHKNVLLMFGFNACGWCHKLQNLFDSDKEIARTLLYEYELVHIDVDRGAGGQVHNAAVDEKYGKPGKLGFPVLVVLDQTGKQLTTQDTGSLEEGDHHNRTKVHEFLNRWKPAPLNANELLSSSLAASKQSGKPVFLYFSAPWCGWCHKLTDWLHDSEAAAVMRDTFETVMIDQDRMPGGMEMKNGFGGGGERVGIPFFVVLDSSGKKLAESIGPNGNTGFPVETFEIEHFLAVVKQTAPGLSPEKLSVLAKSLEKKPR